MNRIYSCVFPNVPPELRLDLIFRPTIQSKVDCFRFSHVLFAEDKEIIIVGVIGKSMDDTGNKMVGFDMVRFSPEAKTNVADGQITFHFDETNEKILYIHFQTTFDKCVMEQELYERYAAKALTTSDDSTRHRQRNDQSTVSFHSFLRTRFAQILLFAIQVCHIIVLVEPSNVFDTSYLNIFKALKIIR